MINKDTAVLVMKVNNYKEFDFFNQHQCMLNQLGFVWTLKFGKRIPENRLKSILEQGGHILFRGSKASGRRCYYARFNAMYEGKPKPDMEYPAYYNQMVSDPALWSVDDISGTWIRIVEMTEVESSILKDFVLMSNGRTLDEALNTSMTSVIYAKSNTSLDLGQGN